MAAAVSSSTIAGLLLFMLITETSEFLRGCIPSVRGHDHKRKRYRRQYWRSPLLFGNNLNRKSRSLTDLPARDGTVITGLS